MTKTTGILFLCVANSARSQMAEGWAHRLAPKSFRIMSAGSEPSRVNPYAIQAMAEVDIDLSSHRSQPMDDFTDSEVDIVVTLCQEEVCPAFLGKATRYHWPFPDPAGVEGDEEEILASFRKVRDQIKERLLRSGLLEDPGKKPGIRLS
jgi:arsenate reductase